MKRIVLGFGVIIVVMTGLSVMVQGENAKTDSDAKVTSSSTCNMVEKLNQIKTASEFSQDAIPEKDIMTILTSGINAPSGLNKQPWHFSVLTDKNLMKKIDESAKSNPNRLSLTDSPVAVIVSGKSDEFYARFDCGTATDRMAVTALALGYGTKIVATPVKVLNSQYREIIGIPQGMEAVAVLLLGKQVAPLDGTSGATTRDAFQNKVNFVRTK